jgi:hypothetical protein
MNGNIYIYDALLVLLLLLLLLLPLAPPLQCCAPYAYSLERILPGLYAARNRN